MRANPSLNRTRNGMPLSMANTADTATRWVKFIAGQAAFPAGTKLLAAFRAGAITRLCDCGCNAFDFAAPEGADVAPLVNHGGYGSVCEMSFEVTDAHSSERGSLEFLVFADQRGHFAGIEVDYCGNSFPVPELLLLHEPPYHVRCSHELAA